MTECMDVVAKKAVIFHQSDFSLTRLKYKGFDDLPNTSKDANNARQLAMGFGIAKKDIIEI